MYTKIGQLVSTLLMLGLILLWSASILGAESAPEQTATEAKRASIELAAEANERAAGDAAKGIAADVKVDLDIRMVGRTSEQVAAN